MNYYISNGSRYKTLEQQKARAIIEYTIFQTLLEHIKFEVVSDNMAVERVGTDVKEKLSLRTVINWSCRLIEEDIRTVSTRNVDCVVVIQNIRSTENGREYG